MYSLLIVEDEPFHRNNLKKLLEELDQFDVSSCKNAFVALQLCEQKNYDIIITDIKMPGLNGLDFIRKLKEHTFNGFIAILSAHADFEYAQKSIELGASAYLLKPFTKNDLFTMISKLVEQVRQRDRDKLQRQSELTEYHRLVDQEQQMQIEQWISGIAEKQTLKQILDNFAIPEKGYLIVIQYKFTLDDASHWLSEVGELVQIQVMTSFLLRNRNQFILISSDPHLYNTFHTKENHYQRTFSKFLIGISEYHYDLLHHASQAYQQAQCCLECLNFYDCKQNYLFNRDITDKNNVLNESMNSINVSGKLDSPENAQLFVDKIFDSIHDSEKYLQPHIVRLIVADYMIQYLTLLLQSIRAQKHHQIYYQVIQAITNGTNIEHIKNELYRLINQIFNMPYITSEDDDSFCAILRYIDEHISDNLSLEMVADRFFFFNPNYFSSYFSKKAHIGFNRYVTILRLEKSQLLLEQSNKKIYEIANLCGYQDVRYFTKLFKQKYHCTPAEYRKKYIINSTQNE